MPSSCIACGRKQMLWQRTFQSLVYLSDPNLLPLYCCISFLVTASRLPRLSEWAARARLACAIRRRPSGVL